MPEDSTQTNADAPAQSDAVIDARPWAEKNLFQTHHKPGTELYRYYLQEYQNKCAFFELLEASSKLKRENPAEWQRQWDAEKAAEDERYARRQGEGHQQSQPFIATPLQTATWKAQSEKFARQRGEIVEPQTAPIVESKRRDIAYQLSLDGFTFFEDGEPCPIPPPSGIRTMGASMPPGYRSGSCQIPSGLRWDAIQFVWVQK